MHVPKTSAKPPDTEINIDIDPVILTDLSLPSKRFPPDLPDSSKDLPEDISAIIDQLDDHIMQPGYASNKDFLRMEETQAGPAHLEVKESEIEPASLAHEEVLANEIQTGHIEQLLMPDPQVVILNKPEQAKENDSIQLTINDNIAESVDLMDLDKEAKKPVIENNKEKPDDVVAENKESENVEGLESIEKGKNEGLGGAGSCLSSVVGQGEGEGLTGEVKKNDDKVLNVPLVDNSLEGEIETGEIRIGEDRNEKRDLESKRSELGEKEKGKNTEEGFNEIKLAQAKSAEVKLNEPKIPKIQEAPQNTPKPPEVIPKISAAGKSVIERAIKANRSEETVSLPPARKNSAIEKTSRILTLEEIKEKKRLEAQMKEIEKESQNSAKSAITTKTSLKTEEKTQINEPKNILYEPKTVLSEPKTVLSEPKTVLSEPKAVLNEPKTGGNEPKIIKIDSKIKKIEEQPKAPIAKVEASIQEKKNEIIQLPIKRPPQQNAHLPAKLTKVQNNFPILVTQQEWEPFKQTLKSLDFSGFNLSQNDMQECLKLAEVLSTPEGVSKVIFDLEQKLVGYPDVKMDSEFESLSLTEKIEKLYEDMFRANII